MFYCIERGSPVSNGMCSDFTDGGTRYRNQAAQRVLTVLSAFAGAWPSRGVTKFGRALGMNKNMVHRAVSTLCGEDFVTRDASGERYQLGYGVLDIGGGPE